MKVAIISHSYLEPENQKNILALNALCDVRCILPRHGPVLIFHDYEFKDRRDISGIFFAYRPFYLAKAQYMLGSLTMGLLKFKPDVINIEYNPWSIIFFQALLYRRIYSPKSKIVCTLKKNTYRYGTGVFGKIKDWVARFSLRRVDHIIAASNMVSDLCKSEFTIPARKVSVCHHLGVDVSLFSRSDEKSPVDENEEPPIVVGYCGRLDADKGILDLVEAMLLVKQSTKRAVVLKLMGCGAYGDFLDDHLRNESYETDWLELLPPVPNAEVAKFLGTLDIFVLPSRILEDHQEHDAHILLEAMACGVPCIGTKSGIIPEILGSGEGFLVTPQNPQALFGVLSFLISNPGERSMLSERGRNKSVEEFSLSVIAKKKCNIFRGIVNENLLGI
ncbi:MAG: glycosyl transferase family 1 [marine bacterium B5-7]|nr:MAG: glycosyl transferase family 1 [marine bacterium B5-7]